jgi:uncharacterized protein involved in exopolysaccharide biosynthesis
MREDNILNSSLGTPDEELQKLVNEFDPIKLLYILRSLVIWMVLILSFGIVCSHLFIRYTKPIHFAYSNLKLELQGVASFLQIGIFKSQESINNYLDGEMEFIKSRVVTTDIIKNLKLETTYYTKGRINDEERYKDSPFVLDTVVIKSGKYGQKFSVRFLNKREFELSYEKDNELYTRNVRTGFLILLR